MTNMILFIVNNIIILINLFNGTTGGNKSINTFKLYIPNFN